MWSSVLRFNHTSFGLWIGLSVVANTACAVGLPVEPLRLSPAEHSIIAEFKAAGRERVPLLIAAQQNLGEEVAGSVAALDGEVAYFDREVEFLYALVPLSRLPEMLRVTGIEAQQVDAQYFHSPING